MVEREGRADLAAGPYGRLAVGSNPLHTEIWNIGDPDDPILLAQWNPNPSIDMRTVAIKYPFLWLRAQGGQGTGFTYTYDITDPTSPQPLDPGFWDSAHEWNSFPWGGNIAAELTDDANYLVLSRSSVLLRVRFEGCAALLVDGFESGSTSAWSAAVP